MKKSTTGPICICAPVATYLFRWQLISLHKQSQRRGLMGLIRLVAIAILVASPLTAQTEFLDRAITFRGETYRYQVYVPSDYTLNKAWLLIVSLHGSCGARTAGCHVFFRRDRH